MHPWRGLVWQPLTDNKRSGCGEAWCFLISLAFVQGCVLKDGDSLPWWQTESMGGRLAACAGCFFSVQRISLKHSLQQKAGVRVSSG